FGELGLCRAEPSRRHSLGQTEAGNCLGKAQHQFSLEIVLLGVGQPELEPYVAAGVPCRRNLLHHRLSFSSVKSFNRLTMRFISGFGVSLPFLDFFWKAWRT